MPPAIPADLTMPHLRDAHDHVHKAFSAAKDETDANKVEDPRHERIWNFVFDYEDQRGRHWRGKFTNQVLSLGQQLKIGIVCGRRQVGVPTEVLSNLTLDLNYMIAWLEESLIGERPDWAKSLFDLTDRRLLRALWEEVSSHEEIFHGRATPPEKSQDEPREPSDDAGALVHAQVHAATAP